MLNPVKSRFNLSKFR